MRYSIYLVRDVLTVGTWNIKRGNNNLVMQGWLIAAQRPDILGVQEVYVNKKKHNRTTCLSVRTRNAQYFVCGDDPLRFRRRSTGSARFRSTNPKMRQQTIGSPARSKEQRCLQKMEYVIGGKRVSVYNTHFSYRIRLDPEKAVCGGHRPFMDADPKPV